MIKFLLVFFLGSSLVIGQDRPKKINIKKVKKYKQVTEVDLSGSLVKGKAKTPDIFYIFQRKRVSDRFFVVPPENLVHHKGETVGILKGVFRK